MFPLCSKHQNDWWMTQKTASKNATNFMKTNFSLTYLRPKLPFYAPLKMFSGGIEREHWNKMGINPILRHFSLGKYQSRAYLCMNYYIYFIWWVRWNSNWFFFYHRFSNQIFFCIFHFVIFVMISIDVSSVYNATKTLVSFNPLSANPTKWPNTLKQFVGNVWVCLTILWGWCLKG